MNNAEFLDVFRQAIAAIKEPRFYESERGYQGELLVELSMRLRNDTHFPGNPILEQEYQKRSKDHGMTIRPDLILHIPFERGDFSSHREGNFVAIELKLRASEGEAKEDFESLLKIENALDYPLVIFLNIDSDNAYAHACPQEIAADRGRDSVLCCKTGERNGKNQNGITYLSLPNTTP